VGRECLEIYYIEEKCKPCESCIINSLYSGDAGDRLNIDYMKKKQRACEFYGDSNRPTGFGMYVRGVFQDCMLKYVDVFALQTAKG
jgi:hypothetical protein